MRTCPFDNCKQRLPDHLFACLWHWRSIRRKEQALIFQAYEAYTNEEISLDELRLRQRAVLDFTQGVESFMSERARCASCHAEIIWTRTSASGSLMPVDAEPVEGGNIKIVDGVSHVMKGDLFEPMVGGPSYVSHFVTCPNREQHRRKK